jgi:glycosyltransferase involved in cell wall biosynthesis
MTGPLRILMVSPGYHPLIGGAETHVRLLSEELVRLRHSVTVLTYGCGLPADEMIGAVRVLRTAGTPWRYGEDRVPWEEREFGMLAEIESLLDGEYFDVVHGQCQAGALLAAMIKRRYASRLIVSMHETEPEADPLGDSRSSFVYHLIPHDAVIAGSEFFFEQALFYGAPSDRVHTIPMGVDTLRWDAANVDAAAAQCVRQRMGIPVEAPLALLVGRFKPRKGILEFIEAIGLARRELIDLHALVVGSGNSASAAYLSAMHEAISAAGLSHAVAVAQDRFSADEMSAVFASADVVAQPSHREGLGLAAIEALAAAKPVVASDIPGLREVIRHQREGILVKPRDPDALAKALLMLLADRPAAERLARAGQQRVRTLFSIRQTAEATVHVYRTALQTG